MANRVSNSKHLTLLLLLGLGLVPALGIVVAVLAPSETPQGPGMSTTTRLAVATAFVVIGLVIAGYVVRTVPARLELADTLTIHYLLRKRVVPPGQVTDVSVEDRNVTLKSSGSLPMTAKDTLVTIRFADGSELSLSLPKGIAVGLQAAAQRWRQGASDGGPGRRQGVTPAGL
jgi:hypothetical protein